MPIYEYRCTSCGHELEALQKITDVPLTQCPACSESALQKKVSAAGFQLKGSGWYVTDFRNSGAKRAAKGDAAAGKGNGETGDGKAGDAAKPDTTTETTSTKSGGSTETKSTTTVSADKSAS